MAESEPMKFVPPKSRWKFWNTYTWKKFMYYANFPRGRYITIVLGATATYIGLYNGIAYLVMGPNHPINNYGWKKMKSQGLLGDEMLEKERLVTQFDIDKIKENTNSFWPHSKESGRVSQIRLS